MAFVCLCVCLFAPCALAFTQLGQMASPYRVLDKLLVIGVIKMIYCISPYGTLFLIIFFSSALHCEMTQFALAIWLTQQVNLVTFGVCVCVCQRYIMLVVNF